MDTLGMDLEMDSNTAFAGAENLGDQENSTTEDLAEKAQANNTVTYSAIAMTGGLLGLMGGVYALSKKRTLKKNEENRRKQLLISSQSTENLLNAHTL